jgi:class 3 adenylate cyclase
VLTQRVADATVAAGRDGDADVRERPTIGGDEAFSTVVDVAADDLDWWVVAELDVDAAEGDLGDFQEVLIVGSAIFVVVLAFLAVGWANRIVRPVRAISDRLGSDLQGGDRVEVPPRSPIEFHQLAASFESMSHALLERQNRLSKAREDRILLLRRLLPPNVADRVAAGDVRTLEEVPEASVVVIVLGLDTLVATAGDRSDRDLVDRVHADLDELADRQGVERVKVVGDAYFAACGHDRPYLDHARRAVGFAADAQDAVREISQAAPANVDVSIGIHAGPVTVGMTGGTRMIYDVWGASVTRAHNLARRADRGQILISDEARRRLPDTIETTRRGAGEQPIWEISSTSVGRRP